MTSTTPLIQLIADMQRRLTDEPVTQDYGIAEIHELENYHKYVTREEIVLYNTLLEYFKGWISCQIKQAKYMKYTEEQNG